MFKTPDDFVNVFLKFQSEMILLFLALAVSQSCTTLVIHVQTNKSGGFWIRQLLHNIPGTSLVNVLPLYDIVMCMFLVELFLKRFYNYYVPVKIKSALLTQQRLVLVEYNSNHYQNWFDSERAQDVTFIRRYVNGA